VGPFDMPGNPTRNLARVTEQCAAGCAANGGIAGLNYRSANWQSNWAGVHNWRANISHVTGAHSRKFGYIGTIFIDDRNTFGNSLNLTYRLNNGVPNGVTETALPMELHQRTRYNAFFAQEQWTVNRMTLQGAIRFDRAWSYFAPQTLPASNYLPFTVSYPKTEGVRGYKDVTPRFGIAYDLFGNAKTALKFNMGQVPRGDEQRRGLLLGDQPDQPAHDHVRASNLERRQPELRRGLRPVEHVAERRVRSGQHVVRQGGVHHQR
jgi:hypothetical protein